MEYLIIALQLIVGISLINVWLIQPNKPSKWRGGDAQTLKEEFSAYGLPAFLFYVVGFFKVGFALLLLASIYFTVYADYAAYGLAFFLAGSVIMHIKISDPIHKSFPAVLFLSMCLVIALLN
jgi:preprotein translocase subunit SecG